MPKTARKQEELVISEPEYSAADTATVPLNIEGGLASPARQLQSYLENSWDEREEIGYEDDRWSIRRMMLFVFVVCTAFWASVIFIGSAIF